VIAALILSGVTADSPAEVRESTVAMLRIATRQAIRNNMTLFLVAANVELENRGMKA
jgi:hypothetical protein